MSDSFYIFNWWFFVSAIGVISTPLTFRIFKNFRDGGYGFSKILGVLLIPYASFFFAIVRILPFTRFSLLFLLSLLIALNTYLFLKNKDSLIIFIKKNWSILALEEILFAGGLLLWSYIRSFQPDINGLEKFMDYGFVNSALQSTYLPPTDMWFAGKGINYYWFGHFATALLTKLADIPSSITYNLMLGTILGLSLSGAFSFITNLLYFRTKLLKAAVLGGLISAILLNFAGNFHTPYYIYKSGEDKYWYPDATRFIGYNPETEDKTIHEFPIYSYVVSDLHAHLLNLPFVILFIALLYNLISSGKIALKNSKNQIPNFKQFSKNKSTNTKFLTFMNFKNLNLELGVSPGKLILLGFLFGVMFMTNAWDFANYMLLLGISFLFVNIHKLKFSFDAIYKTAIYVLIVIVSALITVLPFILNFESIAEGVKLTHTKSPLWQLAILWGFPGVLTLIFLAFAGIKRREIKTEDVVVVSLLTAAWVLIVLPEFIYVKDIYIASHYRANTMFKLTYQAYVMSYLASGYIAVTVIKNIQNIFLKAVAVFFFLLIFYSIMKYPFIAVKSYYGDLSLKKSLNGEAWLADTRSDVSEAIDWLRQKAAKGDVILEAPGDSYTEFNVISSYTGLPTVSGWFVHEWLWRGSPDAPQERVNDITQIYTREDNLLTMKLLRKYNIKYVIVGDFEREKYPDLIEAKFDDLGREVFTNTTLKIFEFN